MQQHIFHDPERRRWKRLKPVILGVAGLISALLVLFLMSILVNPVLPQLRLPLPKSTHLSGRQASGSRTDHVRKPELALQEGKKALSEAQATRLQHEQTATGSRLQEVWGFTVDWDDASLASLKDHLSTVTNVSPEWLHVERNGENVRLTVNPEEERQKFLHERALHNTFPAVYPLLNNVHNDQWDGTILDHLNSAQRTDLADQLVLQLQTMQAQGVVMDIESLPVEANQNYIAFLQTLAEALHRVHMGLAVTVPIDQKDFPYQDVADVADRVLLMAYDEHWMTGKPGPIASFDWFSQTLAARLQSLPEDKTVVLLGNYAYDWDTQDHRPADALSIQDAIALAADTEATTAFDAQSMNPTFTYQDDDNHTHQVWMLDAATVYDELVESSTAGLTKVGFWRMGMEDPGIWPLFDAQSYTQDLAKALGSVTPGYTLNYSGSGEVLKVTTPQQQGKRDIETESFDGVPLVTYEEYTTYPKPYALTRWGTADPKKLVLTFDDGPDAQWTPQILDVLKQYGVPAAFFIIGQNGEQNPDLVQRIVKEGYEVGNHTYTHPNLSLLPDVELRLELSTMERLLESLVGRRTLLFRPPYAEDIEPDTPDEIRVLQLAGELGYYTVGMRIDPGDWEPGMMADRIVANVEAAAKAGDGHVILLHDAGGDRSQTVAALKKLIPDLQRQGYRFVAMHDLLGITMDQEMPPISGRAAALSAVNTTVFDGFRWLSMALADLFFVGIVLGILRSLLLVSLAVFHKSKKRHKKYSQLSVAIIVPCYNEERVVAETVRSLLQLHHRPDRIVVVDDGSTDGSLAVLREAFGHEKQVEVVSKPNGGKASAINTGLEVLQTDIVVIIDADTVVDRDALGSLLQPFADSQVAAVAGNIKVGNRISALTLCQSLEYITGQQLERRAFAMLNAITVVPGALGAFRREALLAAGGYTTDTLAEDADVTLRLLAAGHRVETAEDAMSFTEAPQSMRDFLKQRFRWTFGTLQVFWKHRRQLFSLRHPNLGWIALLNMLFFQLLFPLISPIIDLGILWIIGSALFQWFFHPASFMPGPLEQMLYFYALFMVLDTLLAAMAFFMERRESPWQLLMLLPQRFFYRQLLYLVLIRALIMAVQGQQRGWGKLARTGMVKQ